MARRKNWYGVEGMPSFNPPGAGICNIRIIRKIYCTDNPNYVGNYVVVYVVVF
jgi:hypothetical protein